MTCDGAADGYTITQSRMKVGFALCEISSPAFTSLICDKLRDFLACDNAQRNQLFDPDVKQVFFWHIALANRRLLKAFPDRQANSAIRDRPDHTVTFIAQVVQNVLCSAFGFVDFKEIPALFAFLVGLYRLVNVVVRFFRVLKVNLNL
jgi:hypothetical protein